MTQEQKRIKIAEKAGWRFHPLTEHLYSEQEKAEAIMCWVRPGNDPWQMDRVPDYFNDLNAMHDAEKSLLNGFEDEPESSEPWSDYLTNLILACPAHLSYHATAAQRAEAFGLTLNLW